MTQTTDLNPTIAGYDLQRRIACGGMSDVFLATDVEGAQTVVIKTSTASADEQTRRRLIREHRLLLAIDHPNVAKVLDGGCENDRPYLVLEYIQGDSLRDRLKPGQPLPWQEAMPILKQVSSALAALHAENILHRDVKPENVLIDRQGNIKLIDLSIGTELPELGAVTSHDQFLGTVDYMAPEQRHRIGIDHRADQYSLAAVTFEILTGVCALGQFRRPSDLNPDLNAVVDEALLKGLERDPDDRFDSVQSFAAAVLAAGTPSQRRLPKFVLYAATFLILILGCALAYLNPRQAFSDQTQAVPSKNDLPLVSNAGHEVFTNSLGMKFVLIPPGTFQMGVSTDDLHEMFGDQVPPPFKTESPAHTVTLTQSFWMGMCEVSVGKFRAFVQDTNYQTTSERSIAEQGRLPDQPVWNDPIHYPSSDDLPVCAVSWHDAVRFCQWLSEREGVMYRLPSEAEWEYACRAGRTGPWCCEQAKLPLHAVFSRPWHQGPGVIGGRHPNRWGLHDMHGNVWEWCQDYFRSDYYNSSPSIDPVCLQRSDSDDCRTLRGGGYFAASRTIRSASRRGYEDHEACTDRGHAIGFRVVRDVALPKIAVRSR